MAFARSKCSAQCCFDSVRDAVTVGDSTSRRLCGDFLHLFPFVQHTNQAIDLSGPSPHISFPCTAGVGSSSSIHNPDRALDICSSHFEFHHERVHRSQQESVRRPRCVLRLEAMAGQALEAGL